jgi:hypothetical protein
VGTTILADVTHARKASYRGGPEAIFSYGFEALGSARIGIIEMSQSTARHFRAVGRRSQLLGARVLAAGDPAEYEARVTDLGLGGARLELANGIAPGRTLTLRLELPGLWDALELAAETVWLGSPDQSGSVAVGVRFVSPSGRALRLLSEALAVDHR